MFERFLTLAASEPDAPALIDGESGSVTTRGGLLARAEELASRYGAMREGEVLAVQLPNSVDFVAAFLAVGSLVGNPAPFVLLSFSPNIVDRSGADVLTA